LKIAIGSMTTGDTRVFYVGTSRIELIQGVTMDHLREGLYTGANMQGVMAAGLAAEIRRVAGGDVERELRAQRPLSQGVAYLTSSGLLSDAGVTAIAHGVVTTAPGGPVQLDIASKALASGLVLLDEQDCRTVCVPQIGWRMVEVDHSVAARELARVVTSHLRRFSGIRTVTVVSRHADYLAALGAALADIRTG
jgi:O-acetyl-ADP-ribose deacetylase (regulator of RNase III)